MKKEFILLLSLIVLSICLVNVNGLAVSSAYGSGYPLEIYPGETKDVQFKLMTNSDEDNLTIKAEILNDEGIVSLIDSSNEYKVKQGDIIPMNIRINVNNSVQSGQQYNIVIKLSDISVSESGGSVSFKGSSTINLNVLVVSAELKETKPAGKGTGVLFIFGLFILILIIAIILVIWVVVRNRRDRF